MEGVSEGPRIDSLYDGNYTTLPIEPLKESLDLIDQMNLSYHLSGVFK